MLSRISDACAREHTSAVPQCDAPRAREHTRALAHDVLVEKNTGRDIVHISVTLGLVRTCSVLHEEPGACRPVCNNCTCEDHLNSAAGLGVLDTFLGARSFA